MKRLYPWHLFFTAHKMKFSIKNFFGKCDQTHSFLRIWPRLLKKSLTENFIFGAVFALAFLHRLERWSWKFRTFCEYVFSMSKLLTDILVFISRLKRKWHLSGFASIALWKNHSNIFLDAHSRFSKTLFQNFPSVYGVLSSG